MKFHTKLTPMDQIGFVTKNNLQEELLKKLEKQDKEFITVFAKRIVIDEKFIDNLMKDFTNFSIAYQYVKLPDCPTIYLEPGSVIYITNYGIFGEEDVQSPVHVGHASVSGPGDYLLEKATKTNTCLALIKKEKLIEVCKEPENGRVINAPKKETNLIENKYTKLKEDLKKHKEHLVTTRVADHNFILKSQAINPNLLPSNYKEDFDKYLEYALKSLEESQFWIEKMNKI